MILASHVVFGAHGFWLPNDPRGSWSEDAWAEGLKAFGRATKTDERRSLAWREHDRNARFAAKRALTFPAVRFDDRRIRAIGAGFGDFVTRNGIIVHACAIMRDHVHLVIARHRHPIEQIVTLLKGAATRALLDHKIHPFASHTVRRTRIPPIWSRGRWKAFLSSEADIVRAIRYVHDNPVKAGLPAQEWAFVIPYVPKRSPAGSG
jgi:REP element-mobilizing transposase RayT